MFVKAMEKVLALVLGLCCATFAVTLNMDQICTLVGDGAKLASGKACDTFYSCSNGQATLQTCDRPYYFSKDDQQCVPKSKVNCWSDESCLTHQIGTWVPVPGSCSGYYYCSASGPLRSDCPPGENFDPISQTCKYESVLPCSPTELATGSDPSYLNLCTYVQNGVYFGNPFDCSDWNECQNNILINGTCPNNLVFNTQLHTCDYKSNWNCTELETTPSIDEKCSSNGEKKAGDSCSSYYQCNGFKYQQIICPFGLFFDTISQKCENRLNARNDCDRCTGTSLNFVNQYSTSNCTGYSYCQNGKQVSTGVCAEGFFDEVLGACIVEPEPKYGCCNPSVYKTTTESSQKL